MKKDKAVKTVRQMKTDSAFLKIGLGAVLFMMAFMQFKIATRDETVIVMPPFHNETFEFINGRANKEYFEMWAWSVSMLAGNINAGNAEFVRGELEEIATPALYRKLMETIDIELQNIVRDSAVVSFTPREVIYDPELNRFFVIGRQSIDGPGVQNAISKMVTYELGFTTERLRVFLSSYSVYEGRPMTAAVREGDLKKLEREMAAQQSAEDEVGQ